LVELDGENNHVHLLVDYPPKVSVLSLVNSLKGVSSYVLRRHLPRIAKYYWKNVLWSPSYFPASCGGASLDAIQRYIEQQAKPVIVLAYPGLKSMLSKSRYRYFGYPDPQRLAIVQF
jgi:putative transposase